MGNLKFAKNSAKLTRHETVGDVDYLVAPTIALVEGILNGELVLAEEVGMYPDAWAGIPVVVPSHPLDDDGLPATANAPETLAEIQIGSFFNPEMDGDKLRGELWIDVAKAKAVVRGIEAINLLEAGKAIEISTAYFRDLEEVAGERDNEEFVGISRNIRPDHIAVLLDSVGACSWEDGCGVPRVNEEGDVKINVLGTARTPSFEGTEEASWADVGTTFQDYRAGFYKNTAAELPADAPVKVENAPQAMKDWIAARSLLGDPKADNMRDLRFFPVVNPSTNKLNAGAVRAVLGGRGSMADIPASALASAQAKAETLLDDHFRTEESKLAKALQVILKALGLAKNEVFDASIDAGEVTFGQPERVEVAYELIQEATNQMNKDEMIKAISDDGRLGLSDELLQGMDDAALEALVAYLESLGAEEEMPPGSEEIPVAEADAGNVTAVEPSEVVPEPDEAPLPDAFSTLAEEFGGADAVRAILTNAQRLAQEAADGRRVLVNEVASLSTLSAEQLETLSDEALKTLRINLLPADYAGQGGGPIQNSEELIPFPMPDVFSREPKEA